MKIDPYHNKYSNYEQKRNYQLHLAKMDRINSRKGNISYPSSPIFKTYNDSRVMSPSKLNSLGQLK